MPYGLASAASFFQSIMCYESFFTSSSLHTFLIYSPEFHSYVKHVCFILQRLLQHQLYVKGGKKCEFHKEKIAFLRYNIGTEGVSINQKKAKTVLQWPTLQTRCTEISGLCKFLQKTHNKLNCREKRKVCLPKCSTHCWAFLCGG